MKNHDLLVNAFKNAWQVDITEDERGLKVGRSKVPYAAIEDFTGNLLKDACECLWGAENLPTWREGGETVEDFYFSLLGNHLTISSTQDAQFRARAFDRVRTYWAIACHMNGQEKALRRLYSLLK